MAVLVSFLEHSRPCVQRLITATFLLALLPKAQAPAANIPIRALALRVADLEIRRQLASATPATIDSLLAMYSDSVVYEHPNAAAVVTGKAAMRSAMPQYIGSIRAVRADPPRVTIGNRVAIIETNVRMDVKDEAKWVPVTRHGLKVIEFDRRGLVRRIIDYPW